MGTLDVPGVKEEDIDIKLDDGQLTIEGHRIMASESSRYSSRFSRSFSLDPSVDADGITATLKNGVLVVTAPKDLAKLEDKIRRIPITNGSADENQEEKDAAPDVPIDSTKTDSKNNTTVVDSNDGKDKQ